MLSFPSFFLSFFNLDNGSLIFFQLGNVSAKFVKFLKIRSLEIYKYLNSISDIMQMERRILPFLVDMYDIS